MSVATTPINGFHLGKLDPVPSPFGQFKSYFAESLGTPPTMAHWGKEVTAPWGMDGNGPDTSITIAPPGWGGCGNCVECTKVHALLTGNYYPGVSIQVPEATGDQTVEQYCVAQKCTPAQLFSDPNTYDQGEDMTTSLTTWCTTEEYGVKLPFTAPVNIGSSNDLMNAVALGGGCGVGIQIQQAQEEQFPNMWKWVPGSPNLGGHAIWVTGYIENEWWALVSWGQLILAEWNFFKEAADEGHAIGLPQPYALGKSPTGLLIAQWQSDLANLAA